MSKDRPIDLRVCEHIPDLKNLATETRGPYTYAVFHCLRCKQKGVIELEFDNDDITWEDTPQ